MKKYIINMGISFIKKYNNYNQEDIEKIKYGLEGIYLTLSKFIIVSLLAIFLGIIKEMLIFTIIYNILRIPSFGLHATKSWICLLSTTILFIGIPYLCILLIIPINIKIVISIVGIVFMFKNSPADTYKRPIINRNRRNKFKFISTILTIIYSFICIYLNINFISNCILFSIILQNCMISPTVYKIFKLPYNNYKTFLKANPEFSIE